MRSAGTPSDAVKLPAALLLILALLGPLSGQAAAPNDPIRPTRTTPGPPVAPPGAQRPGVKTNAVNAARPGPARTNALAGAKPGVGSTNVAGTNAPATSHWQQTLDTAWRQFQSPAILYPVVIGLSLVLLVVWVIYRKRLTKAKAAEPTSLTPARTALSVRPTAPSGRISIQACNVLQMRPEERHVWRFDAKGNRFALDREHVSRGSESLPAGLVAKSWRTLWQRKLNVAWLPAEYVFLRVVQLPRSSFEDTLAMVELQLEKLSPMPVAQVVWSIQLLPHTENSLQTVIVLIVARDVVEEFLGQLEGQGYLADRLELPMLDQLQATTVSEDGVWIYANATGDKGLALTAWWYGGVLQNLDLAALPAANRAAALREQLVQAAWAGEMEGWLTSPPTWHLVADPAAQAEWEPALREGLEQPIEVIPPVVTSELAGLTARRAASAGASGNLLPAEYATRYQQQFVDRLWLRGLMAVGGLYIIGVAVYLIAVAFANYRTTQVEEHVADLGPIYTNAIQLKARYQVLKDRQDLKFAGLDCWKVTALLIPAEATLDSFNFSDGHRLSLNGTAPADKVQELLNFESSMRKAPANDLPTAQPLFDRDKGDPLTYHVSGQVVNWNFSLELKRSETQ